MKGSSILTLIQVFAPTTEAPDEYADLFYEELTKLIENLQSNTTNPLTLLGDFNSEVMGWTWEEENIMALYIYRIRNKRGKKFFDFCDFCKINNLKIVNTLFKKEKVDCGPGSSQHG